MLPEERFDRIERQLEFLASHQAGSAARIEQHSAQIERHSAQIERHSEQIGQLGEFLLRTARLMEDLARRTDERFQHVADGLRDLDDRLLELARAQQRTDERLNILVGVVERYFSNGKRDR